MFRGCSSGSEGGAIHADVQQLLLNEICFIDCQAPHCNVLIITSASTPVKQFTLQHVLMHSCAELTQSPLSALLKNKDTSLNGSNLSHNYCRLNPLAIMDDCILIWCFVTVANNAISDVSNLIRFSGGDEAALSLSSFAGNKKADLAKALIDCGSASVVEIKNCDLVDNVGDYVEWGTTCKTRK